LRVNIDIWLACFRRRVLIAADSGKAHLLSAAEIEPALKAGRDHAMREADRIKTFWDLSSK
jgi:hypothetical protein